MYDDYLRDVKPRLGNAAWAGAAENNQQPGQAKLHGFSIPKTLRGFSGHNELFGGSSRTSRLPIAESLLPDVVEKVVAAQM